MVPAALGQRPSRPSSPAPSNPDLDDALAAAAAVPARGRRQSSPTPRSGTPGSPAGGRCWPTPSRPSSRRSALPAYVLPFWTRAGLDRRAQAVGRGVRDVPARPRARHALRRRAAGRDRLRAQPVDGHLDLYPHMGVWALLPWLLLLTERLVRRPTLLGRRRAGGAWSRCSSSPGTPSRASTCCWPPSRSSRCGCGRRAAAGARRRGLLGGAGVRRGGRGGAALAAVSLIPFGELLLALGGPARPRRAGRSTSTLELKEVLGVFMPDYWGQADADRRSGPFLFARALYVGRAAADAGGGRADRCAAAPSGSGSPCSAALCFAVVVGIPPFVQIVTRLPVFSSATTRA